MEKKCCICGKEFEEYSNNANPVKDGVCCNSCNERYVTHARLLASKIKSEVSFEVVKTGQDFLDLSEKLYDRDFEYLGKSSKNECIKLFRNLVTDEYVIICIV